MKYWEQMFETGEPSLERFAQQVIESLREAGCPLTFQLDQESQRLVVKGSQDAFFLGRLYEQYLQMEVAEQPAFIQQLVSMFMSTQSELPMDFEQVREHLRPKIWCRATVEFMQINARRDGRELDMPHYPLGDHLVSTVVYDQGSSMRSLTNEQLASWNTNYYQAMEIARQNLENDTVTWAQLGTGVYSSLTGDSYDSSRVLLVQRIEQIEQMNEPVAVVPNRETLLVADRHNDPSLQLMMQLVQQSAEEQLRPLCPLPIRLVDGQWESWRPESGHRIRGAYDRAEVEYLHDVYGQQKQLLEQNDADLVGERFIASHTMIRVQPDEPEEQLRSYCVWSDDVPALLPRTHLIALIDSNGIRATGTWEAISELVGDQLVPQSGFYPQRYATAGFPSEDALKAIGFHPDLTPE